MSRLNFPGYANSNGAVGFFSLDTTGYANGVHTIEWSATDTGGNTDGIGSRYFTVQNLSPTPTANQDTEKANLDIARDGLATDSRVVGAAAGFGQRGRSVEEILAMPEDVWTPVSVRRGLTSNAPVEAVLPGSDGTTRITIPEVTRLAIYQNEENATETVLEIQNRRTRSAERRAGISVRDADDAPRYEAYQLVGGELRPLPIGASFDPETGTFYWQPGPGFIGDYTIILIGNAPASPVKKTINIKIIPR